MGGADDRDRNIKVLFSVIVIFYICLNVYEACITRGEIRNMKLMISKLQSQVSNTDLCKHTQTNMQRAKRSPNNWLDPFNFDRLLEESPFLQGRQEDQSTERDSDKRVNSGARNTGNSRRRAQDADNRLLRRQTTEKSPAEKHVRSSIGYPDISLSPSFSTPIQTSSMSFSPSTIEEEMTTTEQSTTSTTTMSTGHKLGRRRKAGNSKAGSTFIRWGKSGCPDQTVYSGYAAAAIPAPGFGGSTELECLPSEPTWNANSSSPTLSKTLITPATFQFGIGVDRGRFQSESDSSIIPCAVCYTTRPTLMIPGSVECPDSWKREYFGYLMSTPAFRRRFSLSSKNYCVDENPDYFFGSTNGRGLSITFIQAGQCAGDSADSPCISYTTGNLLGCTVCSKIT